MPVEARAEGGCTGHGPGHGHAACARPGERARDVRHDVALLAAPDREPATLQAYERTLQSLIDCRAILPMHFGRLMADDDAVRAMLRRRRRALLAKLEGVRGAVELGLRAHWSPTPIFRCSTRTSSTAAA